MKKLILLLALFLPCSAQVAHPRIWLDSATLTRLNALVTSNDPAWTALKARADVLAVAPVAPFSTNKGTDPICYGCTSQYRGSGWGEALTVLSMAYKMTGNTVYSDQVKAVMKVMLDAGIAPTVSENGFEIRNFVGQLGIAFDWIYDQLSSTSDTIGVGSGNDISNLVGLMEGYWTSINSTSSRSYEWYGTACAAEGNYYWGYMKSFGLAAIAFEGDDPGATAIRGNLASRFATCVLPAVGNGGLYSGAYNLQGTAYAVQYHLLDYAWALQTAGQTSTVLGAFDYISWAKQMVRQVMHFTTPDTGFWRFLDEGDIQGINTYTNNVYKTMLNRLPRLLAGTTEGGWAQYMLNRYTGTPDSVMAEFLYKTSADRDRLHGHGTQVLPVSRRLPRLHPNRLDSERGSIHSCRQYRDRRGSSSLQLGLADHAPRVRLPAGQPQFLYDGQLLWPRRRQQLRELFRMEFERLVYG